MVGNLFGFLTAPVIFPIAYALRNIKVVRRKILWIYFDDEDEFGFEVNWWMKGRKENFWTAYKWAALRNPAWNLQSLTIINPDWTHSLSESRVLKYVDFNGKYMDNKGPVLSMKHSKLGSNYVIFILPEKFLGIRKLFRYSFAGKIIGKLWIEFQIGFHTRPTFRLKFKTIKHIA
jgi:hypothetical protein